MADKVIFLKNADGSSWTVPSDWNSAANTVICLGAGAGGGAGTSFNGGQCGTGGASGAIHIATNVTLTAGASIGIGVGLKGTGGTFGSGNTDGLGSAGGDTWFNGTTRSNGVVAAQGGQAPTACASTGSNGAGGALFGSAGGTKTNGTTSAVLTTGANGSVAGCGAPGTTGAGAAGGAGGVNTGGSGGGGANGGAAGTNASATTGAAGGNNRSSAGSGAGGGANTAGTAGTLGGGGGGGGASTGNGGAGSQDTLWTATDGTYAGQTAGPGSGGGSGGSFGAATGGAAGGYGAGGGGAYGVTGQRGGAGSDGLIVIIYTPSTGGGTTTVRRSGGMGLGLRGLSLSGGSVGGVTASVSSSVTHNGTTPAVHAATVTNLSELQAALTSMGGAGGGTIYLRGPAAGSPNSAYVSGGLCDLSAFTFTNAPTIRAADYSDKPIIRGATGSGGFVKPPSKAIFSGIQFEETSTNDTLTGFFYNPSDLTIDRCIAKGTLLASGSPYWGTTTGQRFCDVRGGANITIQNSLFYAIACMLNLRQGASNILVQNNTAMRWGEHLIRIDGSVDGVTILDNMGQKPSPGYDGGVVGDPADLYYNHGNFLFCAVGHLDTVTNLDFNGNALLSNVDHAQSGLVRLNWGDAPDGTPPNPTAISNVKIRNSRAWGGLPVVIAINDCGGTGIEVYGNTLRSISDSAEVPANEIGFTNTTATYHDNDARFSQTGSTLDTSAGGNLNTALSLTRTAALADTEFAALALSRSMQTLATAGLT